MQVGLRTGTQASEWHKSEGWNVLKMLVARCRMSSIVLNNNLMWLNVKDRPHSTTCPSLWVMHLVHALPPSSCLSCHLDHIPYCILPCTHHHPLAFVYKPPHSHTNHSTQFYHYLSTSGATNAAVLAMLPHIWCQQFGLRRTVNPRNLASI